MAVNETMAQVSDQFFSASIACYSAAIMALCGNYAFGRSANRVESSRSETKELASVSAGTAQPFAASDSVLPDDAAPTASAGRTDHGERLGQRLGVIGVAITAIGVVSQIISAVLRGISVDRLPWGNMFEFASVFAIIAVITYLVTAARKPKQRVIGLFVLVPVVIILVLAGLKLYTQAAPVVAALRSYWLAIHVTAAAISSGIFLVSAVASALYLVKVRHEAKEAAAGGHLPSRIAGSLPSSTALDRLAARTVTFAFPIWTFAIICGAIWAESAWGRYWNWDPKETWAFISWVVYAGYLHARATAGWKGRKAAYLNLLAASTMLFNFVIVNTVVSGLHSYSGLS